MLSYEQLKADRNYETVWGSFKTENGVVYNVYDYKHHATEDVVSVVTLEVNEVGKDELDALYRIQRIIEDKIHEVRNRSLQNEIVSLNSDKYAVKSETTVRTVYNDNPIGYGCDE